MDKEIVMRRVDEFLANILVDVYLASDSEAAYEMLQSEIAERCDQALRK